MGIAVSAVQADCGRAGMADLVIRVDGRQSPSAEAIADIEAVCDAAEDRDEYGRLIIHVSGAPRRPWADDLTPTVVSRWERALRRLERLPAITVAVACGDCGGTALDALLITDWRIAAPSVRLLLPVHAGATWPGLALHRLARRAGTAAVRRMLLLGLPVDAGDALALRLVDELTDDTAVALGAVPRLFGPEVAMRRKLMFDASRRLR